MALRSIRANLQPNNSLTTIAKHLRRLIAQLKHRNRRGCENLAVAAYGSAPTRSGGDASRTIGVMEIDQTFGHGRIFLGECVRGVRAGRVECHRGPGGVVGCS